MAKSVQQYRLMIKVERERAKLYQLVDQYGLSHPKVLQQSQHLDTCLNTYVKIANKENNDTKNKVHY